MAKPRHLDLVAMTTHGRSGLHRALLGSVTEKVLRRAALPVVACRPGTRVGNWNQILVALDGSPAAESILHQASRLARAMGAGLHLVRVRSVLPAIATHHAIPMHLPSADPRPYLDGVVSALSAEGVLALPELREGEETTEISACARDTEPASFASRLTGGRVSCDSCWAASPRASSGRPPAPFS
jgi:nucleotide-binding universal stress UspA family protein